MQDKNERGFPVSKNPPLDKLKGRLKEKRLTYRDFAGQMGMSPSTLTEKLNGRAAFDSVEMLDAIDILEIPESEMLGIFFPSITPKEA